MRLHAPSHTPHPQRWRLLCALLLVIVCGLVLGGYNNTRSGVNISIPAMMTGTHTSTLRMADCHLQNNHHDAQNSRTDLATVACCEWLCSTHAVLPVLLTPPTNHGNPQFEHPLNQAYTPTPHTAYRRAIERPPRLST